MYGLGDEEKMERSMQQLDAVANGRRRLVSYFNLADSTIEKMRVATIRSMLECSHMFAAQVRQYRGYMELLKQEALSEDGY